ncbi:MAG: Rrf2 family transcriptional regulator [Acidobacteriia bacterium]|nr:Rrf2 family transcriptional regulator [Terriglobia bacterium]
MRLTQHTDYALRMLIHAALRAPELTTVGAVSEDFKLSLTHLNKVAQTLAETGYLHTVRGRSGGLRLALPAEKIRLGQIVLATEPDFQIAPCMSPTNAECPIYRPCVLREALDQAAQAFVRELDRWTLSDLVRHRSALLTAIGRK